MLALLDHPNVVKYYECFAEQGTKVKIVMELCEARSALSCAHAHLHPFHCHHNMMCYMPYIYPSMKPKCRLSFSSNACTVYTCLSSLVKRKETIRHVRFYSCRLLCITHETACRMET